MTTEAQVQRAKNPQEALLIIARALDRIEARLDEVALVSVDGAWGEWEAFSEPLAWEEPPSALDEPSEVVVQAPSQAVQAARRQFAMQHLQLHGHLGPEAIVNYGKGGPLWLYLHDRDYVLSLPVEMRRAMVADMVETAGHGPALEMSMDILKDTQADANQSIVVEGLTGKKLAQLQ